MTNVHIGESTPTSLLLWPGVVIVALQWFARFALPVILPDALYVSVIAGVVGGVAILVWWMFFSRVPSAERWGVVLLIVAALAATPLILDRSVATGMMGMMFYIYALPTLSLALVAGAALGRGLATGPRLAVMVTAILIGCGGWALVRTGGFTGDLVHDFAWRWAETPEERLLAQTVNEPDPVPPPAAPAAAMVPDAALPDRARRRAGGPAISSSSSAGTGSRVARLPRSRSRQHRPWCPDRHQLVGIPAGGAVAPADRARLVVVRGSRRRLLHAGAARRRRDRRRRTT